MKQSTYNALRDYIGNIDTSADIGYGVIAEYIGNENGLGYEADYIGPFADYQSAVNYLVNPDSWYANPNWVLSVYWEII